MFTGKLPGAGSSVPRKKPIIRRETVMVPASKSDALPTTSQPSARPPTSRFQLSARPGVVTKPKVPAKKRPAPVKKTIAASRGMKRKSTPTPEGPMFSDESSDEAGASDSDVSRKRLKTSTSSIASTGPKRDLVLESAFEKAQYLDIIQGADCTSGDQIGKFKNPWEMPSFETVELQYPSNSEKERFELKWPKNEKDDYKPMEDIIETIKQIAQFYFPEELRQKYTDEESEFNYARRFTRAWKRQSIPDFVAIVEEFNAVLEPLVKDGTIRTELAEKRQLPLDLVRRITDQIYSRTVSPKVESLRAYENGTDYVYGELLSRFCSRIFNQVKLSPKQVFVDLGSGVGNVVVQAALEVGCESWGMEYMANPCELAKLQAKEFPGRSRLWGIKAGEVNLLKGDFTTSPDIAPVLKRADVVLVNNQAFTPGLNDKLRDMFLDLKTGCKVVSLKPFVPEGHKISMRNISSVANLFVQQRFEYFSGSVSWTDQSGYFYIAVKDSRPLEAFMKTHGGDR